MKKPKVGILSIHPAPYRDGVFWQLAKRKNIEIEVLLYFNIDTGHAEWNYEKPEYPCQLIKGAIPLPNQDYIHIEILRKLIFGNYDVLVIPGYSRATSLLAILFSIISKTSFILNADSVINNKQSKKGEIKEYLKSYVLKKANAFLVPGKASREYFQSYGIPPEKIFEGGYCFDVAKLCLAIDEKKKERIMLRENYHIHKDDFLFLSIGKMVSFRRFMLLVKAFSAVKSKLPIHLFIVGDGPEKLHIEFFLQEYKINNIKLIGTIPFNELPAIYAISDAYIHVGKEPFSTATEYAAIAGLPIVSTLAVGYVHDLTYRGCSPILVELDDQEDISNKIRTVVDNSEEFKKLGFDLKNVALQRNLNWAADEFENAVFSAISNRHEKFGKKL